MASNQRAGRNRATLDLAGRTRLGGIGGSKSPLDDDLLMGPGISNPLRGVVDEPEPEILDAPTHVVPEDEAPITPVPLPEAAPAAEPEPLHTSISMDPPPLDPESASAPGPAPLPEFLSHEWVPVMEEDLPEVLVLKDTPAVAGAPVIAVASKRPPPGTFTEARASDAAPRPSFNPQGEYLETDFDERPKTRKPSKTHIVLPQEFTEKDIVRHPWKHDPEKSHLTRKDMKTLKRKELTSICPACNKGANTYIAVALNHHEKCLNALLMMDKWEAPAIPPIDIRDTYGATGMHYAVRTNNVDLLQWLLENNMSPRARARNGSTPVHDAAATGSLVCIQCMMLFDRDIANIPLEKTGLYPFHLAAMFGHSTVVAWFVEKKITRPDIPANDGSTALHFASAQGHVTVVEFLCEVLSASAINNTNLEGATAFLRAVEEDQPDTMTALWEAGADIRKAGRDGMLPVHVAAKAGYVGSLQAFASFDPTALLATTAEGRSVFHLAAQYGQPSALSFLLDLRSRIDPRQLQRVWVDEEGNTPVHSAAAHGQLDSLRMLCDKKIPLDTQNKSGVDPMGLANENGQTECAIFLALKGNM